MAGDLSTCVIGLDVEAKITISFGYLLKQRGISRDGTKRGIICARE